MYNMRFLQFSVSVLNAIKKQDKNTEEKKEKKESCCHPVSIFWPITLSSERGEFGSEVTGNWVYLTSPSLSTFAKPCVSPLPSKPRSCTHTAPIHPQGTFSQSYNS